SAGRGSVEDAARLHLLPDDAVVAAPAVAGCASRVQVLVRAQERLGGVAEALTRGVEELRSQVDPVHLRAAGAGVAPHEPLPEVPERRGPHLAHAVDVAAASSALRLLERAADVGAPAAAASRS